MIIHGRRKEITHSYLFKSMVKCNKCNKLCIEIPTVHYKRGTEKKPKYERRKTRKIYLYYYCPCCKRRINENKLLPQLMMEIKEITSHINEKSMLAELDKKIVRLDKRINFINEEFDEGLISETYYKEEIKEARKKRNEVYQRVRDIMNKKMKKFSEYSRKEQKDILNNNFNYFHCDLCTKEVVEIERKNETNTEKDFIEAKT